MISTKAKRKEIDKQQQTKVQSICKNTCTIS